MKKIFTVLFCLLMATAIYSQEKVRKNNVKKTGFAEMGFSTLLVPSMNKDIIPFFGFSLGGGGYVFKNKAPVLVEFIKTDCACKIFQRQMKSKPRKQL